MSTFRYNTRVVAVVHSHLPSPTLENPDSGGSVIDLTNDLVEFNCNKSLKEIGTCVLRLVPRTNYFNYLFPNDIINIYVDPGDGEKGFVRLFFGYVDRVERIETTEVSTGAMSTFFTITCSDFSKAVERTQIYFNPFLNTREDFLTSIFGSSNLGGVALMTKGLTVYGSPAEIVENMMEVLLGFGSQWQLPNSYPKVSIKESRTKRLQRAKDRIPTTIKSSLNKALNADIKDLSPSDSLVNLLVNIKRNEGTFNVLDKNEFILSQIHQDDSSVRALATLLNDINNNTLKSTVLDILEFSFVEAMAIDGYSLDTSIWTDSEGSLMSILRGYSNEVVNELCFDLRPVISDGKEGDPVFGNQYSKEPDELGININGTRELPSGFSSSVAGIKYVPSVVMREYPHSVVDGLDLSKYYVFGSDEVKFVPFGSVFSLNPNPEKPTRVVYDYSGLGNSFSKGISSTACLFDSKNKPLKHLDVFPIKNEDVVSSNLGRSDHDIFNLFEMYSTDLINEHWQYILADIAPIITPVSIQRNGLRIFKPSTKFAIGTASDDCSSTGTSLDTANARKTLIRFTLLLDHWNQHNIEYLSGTITLRGMPDLRVGYRLDWLDRKESYYVEAVSHSWNYPGAMQTTVQVSRGQRNDPYPAYIPPIIAKNAGTQIKLPNNLIGPVEDQISELSKVGGGNRSDTGRLGNFFEIINTNASTRSVGFSSSKGESENSIDRSNNASKGKIAVYPDELPKIRDK